ncbi:hypothetical protein BMW23_1121 [Bodo saltans virus]|uniref:Transmembrane protein n=1 Tax=Bodo saltans virus TaxID=2024608 RepID=A0A2H4UW89_9VIRU|nr:hypothetical protein QJ851_gp1101 [Bodo saltans virus]ATZ81164.1 hypothetical protein BMW23_1121 [Bodo saltans virus]
MSKNIIYSCTSVLFSLTNVNGTLKFFPPTNNQTNDWRNDFKGESHTFQYYGMFGLFLTSIIMLIYHVITLRNSQTHQKPSQYPLNSNNNESDFDLLCSCCSNCLNIFAYSYYPYPYPYSNQYRYYPYYGYNTPINCCYIDCGNCIHKNNDDCDCGNCDCGKCDCGKCDCGKSDCDCGKSDDGSESIILFVILVCVVILFLIIIFSAIFVFIGFSIKLAKIKVDTHEQYTILLALDVTESMIICDKNDQEKINIQQVQTHSTTHQVMY